MGINLYTQEGIFKNRWLGEKLIYKDKTHSHLGAEKSYYEDQKTKKICNYYKWSEICKNEISISPIMTPQELILT